MLLGLLGFCVLYFPKYLLSSLFHEFREHLTTLRLPLLYIIETVFLFTSKCLGFRHFGGGGGGKLIKNLKFEILGILGTSSVSLRFCAASLVIKKQNSDTSQTRQTLNLYKVKLQSKQNYGNWFRLYRTWTQELKSILKTIYLNCCAKTIFRASLDLNAEGLAIIRLTVQSRGAFGI